MRCPRLNGLPPPPPGRTGWPWTEETAPPPETMPGGKPWPRISIVTPSYNQGQFIEETIRSVLLQGYPDLEYIIIDGGSTDNSVDTIRKYSSWLTHWVSEPDRGQSHAINKGVAHSTGALWGQLNSDDLLEPQALQIAANAFLDAPDTVWIAAHCQVIDEQGDPHPEGITRVIMPPEDMEQVALRWMNNWMLHQPSVFYRTSVFKDVGVFDERYHFCFDADFWTRLLMRGLPRPILVDDCLSRYRYHPHSKTCSQKGEFIAESIAIAIDCAPLLPTRDLRYWRMALHAGRRSAERFRAYDSYWGHGLCTALTHFLLAMVNYPSLACDRFTWGLIRDILADRLSPRRGNRPCTHPQAARAYTSRCSPAVIPSG